MHTPAKAGTVYLVGAGPGDPTLITVRGLSLLRQAGVVAYDRLVHPALPAEAPATADLIHVGKSPERHALHQEAINALLVTKARQGRVVVRLKGGDPFVFGRGGEEALALAKARVSFEIIPGLSSAISVPAYAGIPVTHRGLARAFTVVTGHLSDPEAERDWVTMARGGTLVVLMGLRRLRQITRRLIEGGMESDTPVAVIRCGTAAEQVVVTGVLTDISDRAANLRSPAVIVVGDVVNLRHIIDWFGAPQAPAPGFPGEGRLALPEYAHVA